MYLTTSAWPAGAPGRRRGGARLPGRPERSRRLARVDHLLDRLAKLAFRIEHELAGGDHAFAFLQPAEDLVIIVLGLRAERDGARVELPTLQSDEDRRFLPAAQNGHVRHQEDRGLEFGTNLTVANIPGLRK